MTDEKNNHTGIEFAIVVFGLGIGIFLLWYLKIAPVVFI
jgi:hypothetical protein